MVIEPNKPTLGLRLIAVLESVKGCLSLVFGIGLYLLSGHHQHPFFLWIVEHFGLVGSVHAPHFIIEMLTHPERFQLGVWTMLAMGYAGLRFTEAYGLWLARRWGEWLALVSAALYIPFEIYAIALGATPLKVTLLVMNVVFVVYLGIVLVATRKRRALAAVTAASQQTIDARADRD